MLGKWHLGFSRASCLPTGRGFQSFLGTLTGSGDHFSYQSCDGAEACGFDLHDGDRPAWEMTGNYSTLLYIERWASGHNFRFIHTEKQTLKSLKPSNVPSIQPEWSRSWGAMTPTNHSSSICPFRLRIHPCRYLNIFCTAMIRRSIVSGATMQPCWAAWMLGLDKLSRNSKLVCCMRTQCWSTHLITVVSRSLGGATGLWEVAKGLTGKGASELWVLSIAPS